MEQIQSRVVYCSLPLGMTELGFEELLSRHSRQYHLDVLPQRLDAGRYRLELLGRRNHVHSLTETLVQDLAGWGGRVQVEHTVPVGKPGRALQTSS